MGRTVWYPGHMAKGRRQLASLASSLDLLIEVRDARAPRLTSSPSLTDGAALPVWTVLSKADLADGSVTSEWLASLNGEGRRAWAVDVRKGVPVEMRRALSSLAPSSSAGVRYREPRIAVVGTPNVGKSTLLNRIVGRRAAPVGGVPGVTRGVSWFRGEGVLAADSPGMLDPREDARVHRMLSWIMSTKGSVTGSWQDHAAECIAFMARHGLLGCIERSWGVDASGEPIEILERIGERLGKRARGGAIDAEAAGAAFIGALSTGKLGRVSLERPSDPPSWEELR